MSAGRSDYETSAIAPGVTAGESSKRAGRRIDERLTVIVADRRASRARINTGIAGEFFVAGELATRGWIATLTAKNTPDVDVLASRPAGDTHVRIQVKS